MRCCASFAPRKISQVPSGTPSVPGAGCQSFGALDAHPRDPLAALASVGVTDATASAARTHSEPAGAQQVRHDRACGRVRRTDERADGGFSKQQEARLTRVFAV